MKAAISRFAAARDGATAVEFGLICVPFLMLLFGVLELAMIFLAATILENATEGVSRRIRTGEFQTSAGNTKADFKAQVCQSMSFLQSKCATDLFVDVRTFSNFAGLAASAPQPGATFDPATTCFAPGNPTDIVLVRVYYKWKLFTPLLGQVFENMGGGSGIRLMSITTAFRNEPYSDEPPGGAAC
ncbi:TadE/TadG family type IV pilus assembly protein [Phenylobacterium sp. J367]|uniref:TadE/TadG family type IV pilus assembly protein n=1 Tax=Phenylobacterium sp. J367 TaxID=2898435 RepID=UPI00215153FB|nr:TadE/TadG family type IV pilus assembly protein [Phenylobacterium sp. J367]MCR5877719.1 pilus assembly protein [Phenylobacterium sp. J367]